MPTGDVDKLAHRVAAALVIGADSHSSTSAQMDALEKRQRGIAERIARLEALIGASGPAASPAPAAPRSRTAAVTQVDAWASPTHRRLQEELLAKGLTSHRFVRAPPEYYDRPLEFRQAVLQAASVHHLCKTIVMENTRVEAGEPGMQKYWLVVVQYSARLHSDKLAKVVNAAHGGKLPKSKISMRLCAEAASDELSGFEHNAVSPIAIRTRLPIILSHRIAALGDDYFWLGAGEVDLKVGMAVGDFIREYAPAVVDCTYEDAET